MSNVLDFLLALVFWAGLFAMVCSGGVLSVALLFWLRERLRGEDERELDPFERAWLDAARRNGEREDWKRRMV